MTALLRTDTLPRTTIVPLETTSGGWCAMVVVLAGLSVPMFPVSASAASETIGKAEKIENRVTGEADGNNRTLAVTNDVHRDEIIRTEAKAQARLRFKDETDIRLGPQATIKLDAFVFSGKKEAAMELLTGTMRFVSGNGPKGSYLIRTPVATIGLRGTTVEVTIRQGRTYVSLHDGQAQVCTRSGRCMDMSNACTYLSVDNRGVTLPQPLSNRVPTFSGQCTGDFCVVDRCSPQLSGAPGANPPAATPPRATPQRPKPPPKPRRPRRVVDEEIDIEIDEPIYVRPRAPIDVYPVFPIDPGFIRPRGPRWPGGGRPEGGGRPGSRPPKGEGGYPGTQPPKGNPYPGTRPQGPILRRPGGLQLEDAPRPNLRGGGDNFRNRGRGGFDFR